jgi:hypothetical protein
MGHFDAVFFSVSDFKNYEDRLKSSWTHLITPSRNFMEVRWWSLFQVHPLASDSILDNAPPTSRKRAADR